MRVLRADSRDHRARNAPDLPDRNFGDVLGVERGMKLVLELLLSLILHPIAFILVLVNLAGRNDLDSGQKIVWGVVAIVWGIGPILYLLVGGGSLW